MNPGFLPPKRPSSIQLQEVIEKRTGAKVVDIDVYGAVWIEDPMAPHWIGQEQLDELLWDYL